MVSAMTDPNAPQDPPPPTEPTGGYATPPQQQPGPPPGGQPAYSQQPPGPPATGPFSPLVGRPLTSDETMWSMLGHLGGIVIGFIAPLIVMLTKGNESPYTRYHSVEALNFQILIAIGWAVALVTSFLFIGFLLYPVLIIGNIIFCVLAGMAANKGETYRYPVSLRLVK